MAKSIMSKTLGDSGLPKPPAKPSLKPVNQKGIMGKGGSLGAGELKKQGSLKGFGKGGRVQP